MPLPVRSIDLLAKLQIEASLSEAQQSSAAASMLQGKSAGERSRGRGQTCRLALTRNSADGRAFEPAMHA